MGLVDEINANTAYVASAKLALERTLREKGVQVTADNTSFPTFDQLNTAIGGLMTVSDIAGAEDTAVYANNDIKKGDVCALTALSGDYVGELVRTAPTQALKGTSTISVSSKHKTQMFERGDYVFMYGTDNYPYPFYWNGTKYVQLKVDGVYNYLDAQVSQYGYNSDVSFNRMCVDNGKLYHLWSANAGSPNLWIYRIDLDNMNLTLIHSKLSISNPYTYSGATMNLIVHNNNVWVSTFRTTGVYDTGYPKYFNTHQYYYDETAGTLTRVRHCLEGSGYNATGSTLNAVFDMTYDTDDNLYLYIYSQVAGGGLVRKLTLGADGIYANKSQTPVLDVLPETFTKTTSDNYIFETTVKNAHLNISFGCNSIVYINSANVLKYCIVDNTTMTLTEVDVPFSDGLDLTQIVNIALTKGSGVLFIQSKDTNLDVANRVRIYTYDFNISGFAYVGVAPSFLNPEVPTLTMPYCRPIELLSAEAIPYIRDDNNLYIYKVGVLSQGYDYYAEACASVVSGAASYAIAKYDIATGEIGNVTKILG